MKVKKVVIRDIGTKLNAIVIQPDPEDFQFFKEQGWGADTKIFILLRSRLCCGIGSAVPEIDLRQYSSEMDVNRTTINFSRLLSGVKDISMLPDVVDVAPKAESKKTSFF